MEQIKKKKSNNRKFLFYFLIIFAATAISLTTSLWGKFDLVFEAISSAKVFWIVCIVFIVGICVLIEALIVKVFCRLYTRNYPFSKATAVALTGSFYSAVTPGASGGQIMQTYTLKNQGIKIASGASIFVMSFIIYQTALFAFDITAIIAEKDLIFSITTARFAAFGSLSMTPIIIIGFIVNAAILGFIYLMSYSKFVHNFILGPVMSLLAKFKIIKNLEQTRIDVASTVENYKLELKRLHSNVPVAILIFLLYYCLIFVRNSIPYFSGLALQAYGNEGFSLSKLTDASFISAFQQMITGLVPLPGGAGISEYTFEILFYNYFSDTVLADGTILRTKLLNLVSSQIIWRFFSFHLVLLVSGLVVAFYPNTPKAEFTKANRRTFVALQINTIDERKRDNEEDSFVDEEFEERRSFLKNHQKPSIKIDESPIIREEKIEEPKKVIQEDDEEEWEHINLKL